MSSVLELTAKLENLMSLFEIAQINQKDGSVTLKLQEGMLQTVADALTAPAVHSKTRFALSRQLLSAWSVLAGRATIDRLPIFDDVEYVDEEGVVVPMEEENQVAVATG
jgi:hypothetical protein